ncbi:MAG TPA: glycoside hydrolase family 18 protein [Vicinamibacteria bacterium]|nr:glycoside hydrolase family 18 protein [Vicinamibacteria bacterium]
MTPRLLLPGLVSLAASVGAGAGDSPVPSPVIVGYVFDRAGSVGVDAKAASELTHVNYAFVPMREGRVAEADESQAAGLKALTELRRDHPRLRVLVSVGGWLGSQGFSDMALTAAGRRRFVESVVSFLRRHDLDGLDLDWEYPGLPGAGNRHRPQDRAGFSALLAELRTAFDAAGTARRLELTVAAASSEDYLAHVDVAAVARSADLVNLMTYDFREAEAGDKAGHHANLRTHPADPDAQSAEASVRRCLAAGVPAGKLVLGVPFYGRGWRGVGEGGLYRRGRPLPNVDVGSYPAILALVGRDGWRRGWDEAAQAPFLSNPRGDFVSYEDPDSLRLKCRFVREQHLAGVMFWEYHADPSGVLLGTLASELRPSFR